MGALHEGHLTLVREARKRATHVAVSIFVNPRQFGANEDLDKYPRQLATDQALLEAEGVSLIWAPDADVMYPAGYATTVGVAGISAGLCGAARPGHFDGVATVVCKLFNLAQPTFAVFGEKDWQQLAVIRAMTHELNIPVRVEGRPIMRETDGLAMSSRNIYLTPEERAAAPHIHKGLALLAKLAREGQNNAAKLLEVTAAYYGVHIPTGQLDYLELVDPLRITPISVVTGDVLAAVALRLGKARLIDNILIPFEN